MRLPTESHAAVMGTGIVSVALLFDGERTLSRGLMWLTLLLWVGLVPRILGAWRTPATGASFLLAVSTLALSALAEIVALQQSASWLIIAGALLLVVGMLAYAFVAAAFDLGQLLSGNGDHWIAGGALAIGGLAIAELSWSSRGLHLLGSVDGIVSAAGWVVWAGALAWLPFLLGGELSRPRLGFDVRRWATVFPVGMYAAMSFALGRVLHSGALTDFAQVWVWVAVAVWALVAISTLAHARELHGPVLGVRGGPRSAD